MKPSGALVALALILAAPTAAADQAGDARVAQALFEEGRSLMDQKRFAEACPKLKESQRLDPGGGTLLNLASCHASEGKIATALDEYREALTAATRDNRKDREQIARTNIAALEKDVPRVTVIVPHPVANIQVQLDNTTLSHAAWGVATPVDPGAHVVTVTAPGYATVTVTIEVKSGERKVAEVPRAEKGAATLVPAGESHGTLVNIPPPPRANPAFWGAFGLGMGALTLSAVTGVLTLTNTLAANSDCIEERTYCATPEGKDSLSSARTFGWVSSISFGVGFVALVVAIIVPSKKSVVGLNGAGLRF